MRLQQSSTCPVAIILLLFFHGESTLYSAEETSFSCLLREVEVGGLS